MSRKPALKRKNAAIIDPVPEPESSYDDDSAMEDAHLPTTGFRDNIVSLSLPLYRDTNVRERVLGSLSTDEGYAQANQELQGMIRYFCYFGWKLEDQGETNPYKIDAVRKITNSLLALSAQLNKKETFKFALEKPWTPQTSARK